MSKTRGNRIDVDFIEKITSIYYNLEDTALKVLHSSRGCLNVVIDVEINLEADQCVKFDGISKPIGFSR